MGSDQTGAGDVPIEPELVGFTWIEEAIRVRSVLVCVAASSEA